MAHKVEILDIDHVEHAGRLIIKYQLCCPTFDADSPGWFYISAGTAYRGLCDVDWICMTPNVQHPLHSQEIKTPGIYFYVWDYHGVQGLSAQNFTSETSFIIQIALQDTGCFWSDPCDTDPCLTPDTADDPGAPVEGDVGTQGNCGPGYLIELDVNGCPCCVIDDWCDIPGNGNTVPSGPNEGDPVAGDVGTQGNCDMYSIIQLDDNGCPECVEVDPTPPCGGQGGAGFICIPGGSAGPAGGGPFDGPPDGGGPPGGGGNTHEGGGSADGGSSVGDGFDNLVGGRGQGGIVDGHYAWFGDPEAQYQTHAGDLGAPSDTPDQQTTIGPGPHISYHGGPFEPAEPVSQFGLGYPGTNVSGHLPDWFNFQNPNDPGGDGTYTTSTEKVGRSPGVFRRGGWGGKSPSLYSIDRFSPNQLYSVSIHDIAHPRNPVPSDHEVQIGTRHFIAQPGPTINTVAGGSPSRGKTSVTDAIFVKDGISYIQFHQSFRREAGIARRDGIQTAMSRTALGVTPSITKKIDLRGARKSIDSIHGAIDNAATVGVGRTTSFGDTSGIAQRSPSKSRSTRNRLDSVKNMTLFKNSSSFLNQNYADLNIAPDNFATIGGNIHCSAFATPKEFGKQTFSIGVFIRDARGKVIEVGSTACRSSTKDRRLAVLASTAELSAGEANVIMMMFDVNNVPFFRIVRPVTLTDPAGIPTGRGRNPIDSAIQGASFRPPRRLRLNTDNPRILLLLDRDSLKNPASIHIAAQTLNVNDTTRTHTITMFDLTGFAFLTVGNTDAGFDDIRIDTSAFQGTKIVTSDSNLLKSGPTVGLQPNASAVISHTIPEDSVTGGLIAVVSVSDGKKAASLVDFVVGDDLKIREDFFSIIIDNGNGTFTFRYEGPYPLTELDFFVAGGNNHIPLTPVITTRTTSITGVVNVVNITVNKGDWIGVALRNAPGPLSSRTVFYGRLIL